MAGGAIDAAAQVADLEAWRPGMMEDVRAAIASSARLQDGGELRRAMEGLQRAPVDTSG